MAEEFSSGRKKALKDQLFKEIDQKRVAQIREKRRHERQKEGLAAASGITSETVLERLVELHIDSESLAALSLVPLVLVAWADHQMDEREKAAVIKAAEAAGVDKESIGHLLLEEWLVNRPSSELVSVWKEYTGAIFPNLNEEDRALLRQDVIERTREVAKATGGFLGLGNKISQEEEAVLADIDEVLRQGT